VKYIVKRREARPFSVRFIWAFPVQEIQKMEQRDWELLDKQVQGLRPPRNDGVMVLMVVAVRWHDPRRPPDSAQKGANENRVERRAHCDFTSE
jgi:hypothetical protein